MSTDTTFFTNEPDATLLDRFKKTLQTTRYFDILVGYFRTSGFHRLSDAMEEAVVDEDGPHLANRFTTYLVFRMYNLTPSRVIGLEIGLLRGDVQGVNRRSPLDGNSPRCFPCCYLALQPEVDGYPMLPGRVKGLVYR